MARPRKKHVGKTYAEKRLYIETVIRAKTSPTLEDTPIIDTTDHTAGAEETEPAAYQFTEAPSPIRKFLREKGVELVIGGIILAGLGWGARELYSLNREVGELISNLNNTSSEIGKVEKRLVKQIEGISSAVDKLERRIDSLMDRGSQARKKQ